MQVNGVRVLCHPEKREELREELSRAAKRMKDDDNWEKIAQQIGSQEKWGALTHGGVRKGAKFSRSKWEISSAIGGIVDHTTDGQHGSASALSASAIGVAANIPQTSTSIKRRLRKKSKPQEARGVKPSTSINKNSADRHEPETFGGSRLPEGLCTPIPMADDLPAIGGIDKSLPRVLPATQPVTQKQQRNATYTILERIAGGTFGDVYTAKPKQKSSGLPSRFVVKLTHKSLKKAQATTEQEREVSVMKELGESKHPNILKLLGWRATHFNMQLMFPLYDQDLRGYLKGKPLPPQAHKKLSLDIVRAVACVHSYKILHRDIKPSNILIQCQPLAAILGDFGCARKLLPIVEQSAQQQVLTQDVCTLWYRAPEILLSHDEYGRASDLWSLGVVIVEMLNGIPPFTSSSEVGMLFAIFKKLGTPTWSKAVAGMRDFRGVLGTCVFPTFPCPQAFPLGSPGPDQDLIRATLCLCPSARISADLAVRHAWFH